MSVAPKWKDLLAAFEEVKGLDVKRVGEKLGGKVRVNIEDVADEYKFKNACAIRLSYALNAAGSTIPYKEGKTVSGFINGEKHWFYYRITDMEPNFIQNKGEGLGLVPQKGTSSDAFRGKKGIIVFDVSNFTDASGHLDLYDGEKVVSDDADYSKKPGIKCTGVRLYELTM
ncbi:putative Tae4 (type VI amidase effector 4) [Giardia muris]|uniref:Putative Tae4 (Type VI amidase effector 4) n=1 Tax=Giardia muris TaxID=5742 RepID=A0A4Z1SWG4_GIAMU|nr:putative Tae4 (type VI amidase effector 4) [Giardia muris]|eukprot:TNJ29205.1 putative Tae4 (type VI amidase effector 4) [Giardia muris]